jgi:hypothetical protein
MDAVTLDPLGTDTNGVSAFGSFSQKSMSCWPVLVNCSIVPVCRRSWLLTPPSPIHCAAVSPGEPVTFGMVQLPVMLVYNVPGVDGDTSYPAQLLDAAADNDCWGAIRGAHAPTQGEPVNPDAACDAAPRIPGARAPPNTMATPEAAATRRSVRALILDMCNPSLVLHDSSLYSSTRFSARGKGESLQGVKHTLNACALSRSQA